MTDAPLINKPLNLDDFLDTVNRMGEAEAT